MPSRLMCRVRGIGVAERVRTSTVARSDLSHSLSSTPNRCSSSMMTRPRSLNATSFWTSRCVPIRMSTPPAAVRFRTSLDLGPGPEAVDDLDRERELGHPRGEAAVVLLGQDRGGHEHGDLLAGVDRLERGADGDLGLAVADVAADQAVHRLGLGHVALDGLDGRELVGGLLVGEGGLELGHPVAVLGRVGDPRLAGALRPGCRSARRRGRRPPRPPASSASPRPTSRSSRAPARPCRRRRTSARGRSWRSGTYSFVPSANSRSSVSSACSADWSTNCRPR